MAQTLLSIQRNFVRLSNKCEDYLAIKPDLINNLRNKEMLLPSQKYNSYFHSFVDFDFAICEGAYF